MNSTERVVKERYGVAAQEKEAALCCPVNYDPRFLRVIPAEVIEKDYGCGDPSRFVREGETVLDLGSGAGKICFIAAQVVGAKGRVIGVDMTDGMLEVARRNAPVVAERLGFANVEFRKGRIQDLALDLELRDAKVGDFVPNPNPFLAQAFEDHLRVREPMIASGSIDVVVSNCVLNLVDPAAKGQLFAELHRVLKDGGRAVISDIVSDRPVPEAMQGDPELWSGCISGALTLEEFLSRFRKAGFGRVTPLERGTAPWRTVEGINFWSVTIQADKVPFQPASISDLKVDLQKIPTRCC